MSSPAKDILVLEIGDRSPLLGPLAPPAALPRDAEAPAWESWEKWGAAVLAGSSVLDEALPPSLQGAGSSGASSGHDLPPLRSLEADFAKLMSPRPAARTAPAAGSPTLGSPKLGTASFSNSTLFDVAGVDAPVVIGETPVKPMAAAPAPERRSRLSLGGLFGSVRDGVVGVGLAKTPSPALKSPQSPAAAPAPETPQRPAEPVSSPLRATPGAYSGMTAVQPSNLFSGTDRCSFATAFTQQLAVADADDNGFHSPSEAAANTSDSAAADRAAAAAVAAATESLSDELARERRTSKTLHKRLQREARESKQMRAVMRDWEAAMSSMVSGMAGEQAQAKEQLQQLLDERSRLRGQLDNIESLFKDMRGRYEDAREANAGLREADRARELEAASLQREIDLSNERLAKVVQHAEEQLEAANVEIAKVRRDHDGEISTLRAKLTRSELRTQALEKALSAKDDELKQLTGLCDELVGRLEGRGSG